MQLLITIIQIGVGILLVLLGGAKLLGMQQMKASFAHFGYPQWLRLVVGGVELVGGLLLLGGVAVPLTIFFGAILLAIPLLGAMMSHMRLREAAGLFPLLLLVLVAVLAWQRPLGLQIMMLPQQAEMVETLLPSETVVAHPFGEFLEGVQVAPDGSIIYTNLLNMDFSQPSFAEVLASAHSEIVRVTPDGSSMLLATTPTGIVAAVPEWTEDGLYFSVAGSDETRGLWWLNGAGEFEQLAAIPDGVTLNGIVQGPNGRFYIADSALGVIWRADAATGTVERWIENSQLAPRTFVGLFPGANGIEFWNGDFYVAVPDRGTIVRVPLLADDTAGEPIIHASGISGDDFAIDSSGVLYVTTHPFNSVVKILPDGTLSKIAGEAEGVVGSTDAVLSPDEPALYVVGDGGIFEMREDGEAKLVKLTLK